MNHLDHQFGGKKDHKRSYTHSTFFCFYKVKMATFGRDLVQDKLAHFIFCVHVTPERLRLDDSFLYVEGGWCLPGVFLLIKAVLCVRSEPTTLGPLPQGA